MLDMAAMPPIKIHCFYSSLVNLANLFLANGKDRLASMESFFEKIHCLIPHFFRIHDVSCDCFI
jgi:hypothetical protein